MVIINLLCTWTKVSCASTLLGPSNYPLLATLVAKLVAEGWDQANQRHP